jgi:hypothetical protein
MSDSKKMSIRDKMKEKYQKLHTPKKSTINDSLLESSETYIDDLFQPVKNLLIGQKMKGTSGQENVLEKMNTEIKKNIDKCVQLETQHNPEEYEEFKSEAQKFIITDAILINERFKQFDKSEQILQKLEMNFNYTMNEKKKSGNYTEKDELDQAKFLRLKSTYSGILEHTIEKWGITVSLLSQLKDCYKKLSSIHDKSALPLDRKENSQLALPDDHPLYKDLVDLENEEMFNPTISKKENISFPDKMSRDVISNLSERVEFDPERLVSDPVSEYEVEKELGSLYKRKGGSRRRKSRKGRKGRKSKKSRRTKKTIKNH